MSEPPPEWLRQPGAGQSSPPQKIWPRSGEFRRHEAGQRRSDASRPQRVPDSKLTAARLLPELFRDRDLDLSLRRDGEFWWDEAASNAQLSFLERVGIDAAGISKGGCARVIEYLHKRREAGLATFKQLRLLVRMGHSAPLSASFTDAQRFLDEELSKTFGREDRAR
jgi:hypothetical protein